MFVFLACLVSAYVAGFFPAAAIIYMMTVSQGDAPADNWLSPVLFGLQWPFLVPVVFLRFRKFLRHQEFAFSQLSRLLQEHGPEEKMTRNALN